MPAASSFPCSFSSQAVPASLVPAPQSCYWMRAIRCSASKSAANHNASLLKILTAGGPWRIHLRMTKILTLRLDSDLLGKAEARAVRLGLDRAKYVSLLIEEDLKTLPAAPRKFVSEDLVGMYEGPGITADNATVRERLRSIK